MLTHIPEWFVAVFLLVWFLLSIAFQFRSFSTKLSSIDPLAMLPRWTFFAPNPGIHDHHVVFRCCEENVPTDSSEDWMASKKYLSAWKEANLIGAECVCIPLLWYPSRRVNKVVCDLSNSLLVARKEHREFKRFAPISLEYIALTNLVAAYVPSGQKYQWALVRCSGCGDGRITEIVFLSLFHSDAVATNRRSTSTIDA